MKLQFQNTVMSSFLLWFEHRFLEKGEGFTNLTGRFYPTNNLYNGLYTYSSPYKQFVYDSSVSGATVMSGVYLGNTFITVGQSGLSGINFEEGQLYFSSRPPANTIISGSFAIKDFNVEFTSVPDEKLLFETKYYHKNEIASTPSGLSTNEITFPVIYLKLNGGKNMPFAFGGLDETNLGIRSLIVADSQYTQDAANSICEDMTKLEVPLLTLADMPFDSLNCLKVGGFNYTGVAATKTVGLETIFLSDSHVAQLDTNIRIMTEYKSVNRDLFVSFCDFDLKKVRNPRI